MPASPRREEGAHVDPHVEDRKTRIAPIVVRGIQLADDCTDVWFEEAGTEHDQHESGVEAWPGIDRQAVVSHRDEDSAVEHGIALAYEPVGDPASRNTHEENRGGVETIDRGCRGDVESESPICRFANHEQHEDRPHSVVAESLPELGEEKRRQASRVTADSARARIDSGGHRVSG